MARGLRQSRLSRVELEAKIPSGPVTPELRRHANIGNEIIAEDSAGFPNLVRQRVLDRFDRLEQDGTLSKAEAQAARQLRNYADSYFKGLSPSYQMKVDGGSRPGEAMLYKAEAARKVNAALAHLNSELRKVAIAWVLEGVVPHMGHSFISIGENYHPNVKDAERVRIAGKTLVIATCRELAVHFKMQGAFDFDITQGMTGVRFNKVRAVRSE